MVRPADYPPPFRAADFVDEPGDSADEQIEVGVAIVGAGPAGLACAIRLGQLLEEHPEVAGPLGEVPIAIVEKGKQAGSHLLSGAVVNPRSLQALFGSRFQLDDIPSYGPVTDEMVYVLSRQAALRIPTPPPMRNRGNIIVSLSQLGRWLAAQAEEVGAMVLAETAAEKLLVRDGRTVGVRTGDKGRDPSGAPLPNFEPGSDIVAKVTVLAEGTQGHLTGVALDHFGLRPAVPQVWELGVKEVWRVSKPLAHVIHTMGWPLRTGAKYREFGGSFIYPMGPEHVAIGMVVGLDYRDATLSVHDLLQELKTHPKVRPLLEGGERLEWGAKTIPGGGFHSLPTRLHAPGLLLCGDGAGLVNIPTLKGIHYAVESGRLAAEAAFASLQRPDQDSSQVGPGGLRRRRLDWLHRPRPQGDARRPPGLRPWLLRRRGSGGPDDRIQGTGLGGQGAQRTGRQPTHYPNRSQQHLSGAGRQAHLRQAVIGVRLRQQDPRRPAQPHPPDRTGAPRPGRHVGPDVSGPGVQRSFGGGRRNGHRPGGGV